MERFFFGMVDRLGMDTVTEMAEFAGIRTLGGTDAFRNLPLYMGAQRSRTPRGLDEIKRIPTREDLRLRLPRLMYPPSNSSFRLSSTA